MALWTLGPSQDSRGLHHTNIWSNIQRLGSAFWNWAPWPWALTDITNPSTLSIHLEAEGQENRRGIAIHPTMEKGGCLRFLLLFIPMQMLLFIVCVMSCCWLSWAFLIVQITPPLPLSQTYLTKHTDSRWEILLWKLGEQFWQERNV